MGSTKATRLLIWQTAVVVHNEAWFMVVGAVELHQAQAVKFHERTSSRCFEIGPIVDKREILRKRATVDTSAVRLPVRSLVVQCRDGVFERHIAKVVCTHTEVVEVLDVVLDHKALGIVCTRCHVERQARIPVRDVPVRSQVDIHRERDVDVPTKSGVVVKNVALRASKRHARDADATRGIANSPHAVSLVVDKHRVIVSRDPIADDVVRRAQCIETTLLVKVAVAMLLVPIEGAPTSSQMLPRAVHREVCERNRVG